MRREKTQEDHARVTTRLTLVTAGLGVSVVTNLVLAVIAMSNREIVLVPDLPAVVRLQGQGAVSREYLESVARDCVFLFLDRTVENQDYFDQQLLAIADAQTYQHIRAAEIDARAKATAEHASQTFIPTDWYVDPGKLYVEVAGSLVTNHGDQVHPTTEQKNYVLKFVRHGVSLRLLSFEEMPKAQTVGLKLPTAPPPRTTPITPEVQQ